MAKQVRVIRAGGGSRRTTTRRRRAPARWQCCLGAAGSLRSTPARFRPLLVFPIELIVRGSLAADAASSSSSRSGPAGRRSCLFALLLIGFDALFGRRHNGILLVAPVALAACRYRPPEIALSRRSALSDRFPLFPPDRRTDAAAGARAAPGGGRHRRRAALAALLAARRALALLAAARCRRSR